MAQYANFYIELPSYLIKYIIGACGQNYLTAKTSSNLGVSIINMTTNKPGKDYLEYLTPGENKLHIRVCDRYTQNRGSGQFLRTGSGALIRRKINAMFREDLYHHVRSKHLDTNVDQKQLIRGFFEMYKIEEDDFSESSMYRDYSRWKESKKVG